jgi:DNA polymerase
MRHALNAIADELRRLKSVGVESVAVSEEGLRRLRAVQEGRKLPAVDAPPPAPSAAPPDIELPAGSKAARWAALREIVLNDPVCLSHVRPGKKVVFGVGSLDARIMFVGEAPGAEEEVQGEPFVGPAGQLLTRMIAAMGLDRGGQRCR